MIPIRDTTVSRNVPVINNLIIGLNILVYVIQMTQGPDLERFIYTYGLVPARYSDPRFGQYFTGLQQVIALLSFMFLHGGFWHILGNMWSLYIFGDNVEDNLGHSRYLVFYLLCGIASGVSHLLLNWQSNVPTIGASGAIAGVMGAYFILHPNSRILTLIPIIFIPWFIEVPAYIFLGIWFVLQFISAASSSADVSGIAWWAHVGGFVFGIVFLKVFAIVPSLGFSKKLRPVTTKKKSYRLQVVHPAANGNDPNLYGSIVITPYEAATGTYKLVNVPWGFHKRMVRVAVPAGIKAGKRLRLKGLGKKGDDGRPGDLYLKVVIRS